MRRWCLPVLMVWGLGCAGIFGGEDELPVETEPEEEAPEEEEPDEAEDDDDDDDELFDTGEEPGDDDDDDDRERKGEGNKRDPAKKKPGEGGGGQPAKKKPGEGGGGGKAKELCMGAQGAVEATVHLVVQGSKVTDGEVTFTDTKKGSGGSAKKLTGTRTEGKVTASAQGTVDGKADKVTVVAERTDNGLVLTINGREVPKARKRDCP